MEQTGSCHINPPLRFSTDGILLSMDFQWNMDLAYILDMEWNYCRILLGDKESRCICPSDLGISWL